MRTMRFVSTVHSEVCMWSVSTRVTVQTDGMGSSYFVICCSLQFESTVMTSNGGLATSFPVATVCSSRLCAVHKVYLDLFVLYNFDNKLGIISLESINW